MLKKGGKAPEKRDAICVAPPKVVRVPVSTSQYQSTCGTLPTREDSVNSASRTDSRGVSQSFHLLVPLRLATMYSVISPYGIIGTREDSSRFSFRCPSDSVFLNGSDSRVND